MLSRPSFELRITPSGLVFNRSLGIPHLFSWTLLLLAVLMVTKQLGFWAVLTLVQVVVLHELGHALVIKAQGHQVEEVVVHAFGGWCSWRGDASPLQIAVIAWGGVAAQLLLLLATLSLIELAPSVAALIPSDVYRALIPWNALLILFNLLPIQPLDGAKAWRLFPELWAARRPATGRGKKFPSKVPKRLPSKVPRTLAANDEEISDEQITAAGKLIDSALRARGSRANSGENHSEPGPSRAPRR